VNTGGIKSIVVAGNRGYASVGDRGIAIAKYGGMVVAKDRVTAITGDYGSVSMDLTSKTLS